MSTSVIRISAANVRKVLPVAQGRVALGPRAGSLLTGFRDQTEEGNAALRSAPRCASFSGFSLHANVCIPARARRQLEKLQSFVKTEQFYLVAATDVIEHIEDDKSAARGLLELVRSGGKVLITVPALPFLFGYYDSILGHYRRYTRQELLGLFVPYLRIQYLRYFGISLIPAALVLSKWLRRPYPAGKVGSIKEKRRSLGSLVSLLFSIEKKISPPVGTSLLLMGIREHLNKTVLPSGPSAARLRSS